ncbi:MAG: sulfite exporter TauE/SafE family protein [bacterium]
MDELLYRFPASGVETYVFLPPLIMFLIASATSMGGVTGAFILLPYNMSVLGYTSPGVSATNFVYNIVAIPLGVIRRIRDGHLSWSLFAVLAVGTLPGVFAGYYLRMTLLPNPAHFKPFVGLVLAYLAVRTFVSVWQDRPGRTGGRPAEAPIARITGGRISAREITMIAGEQSYSCRTAPVLFLSLAVGVVGGAYGIGGGAVMAPFCIAVLRLPPFVVAGASLLSTWVTSVVGALFYAFMPVGAAAGAAPDWLLGGLYGLGGMAGVYLGARLQNRVPAHVIKVVLGVALLFIAVRYLAPPVMGLFG